MRFLIEMAVFLVIGAVAVLIGALVIWILGIPFQIIPSKSAVFAMIGFCFVFPGAANIWIMMRGSDGESTGERVCAGIRGFGMLLCAVAVALPFVIANAQLKHGVILFIIASILWLGTIPFENRITTNRLRAKELIVERDE
jgi:hypothetical protein